MLWQKIWKIEQKNINGNTKLNLINLQEGFSLK